MASVCAGPVMTVTRSPRATRSCATLSSGLMWPVGDSAAMRISAIVRYLSYPGACQLAAAERLAHGRHERHPQRVVGGVVGLYDDRELHGSGRRVGAVAARRRASRRSRPLPTRRRVRSIPTSRVPSPRARPRSAKVPSPNPIAIVRTPGTRATLPPRLRASAIPQAWWTSRLRSAMTSSTSVAIAVIPSRWAYACFSRLAARR